MKEQIGDYMDWSKAKTILIISFILVNIILVYNLILGERDIDLTVDKVFAEDVIDLLENKNIKLNTEIPQELGQLSPLLVQYEELNMGDINREYFGNKADMINKGEGLSLLEYGDEKVTIVNGKLLIYESQKRQEEYNIEDIDEAAKLALEFLNNRGYNTSDLKLSQSNVADGIYSLEFSKVYNDRYLESAFTNVMIDNTGVKKLERLWLNVREESNTKVSISNAHKAILGLLNMNRAYNKTIEDISLSYYFDPEIHEYIENPEMAKQGRAIPAWRVQFEGGYTVFLDDY